MPSTCPLGHPGATDRGGGRRGGGRSCCGFYPSQSAYSLLSEYPLTNCTSGSKVELHYFYKKNTNTQIPAAVLVTSFTVELVSRKNCEDALL